MSGLTTHPCKDCGRVLMGQNARCVECARAYERRRNSTLKRRAYRDPVYTSQSKGGVCWICGLPGADTRDHVIMLTDQMRWYGEVRYHETRPAHRACNSARNTRTMT